MAESTREQVSIRQMYNQARPHTETDDRIATDPFVNKDPTLRSRELPQGPLPLPEHRLPTRLPLPEHPREPLLPGPLVRPQGLLPLREPGRVVRCFVNHGSK